MPPPLPGNLLRRHTPTLGSHVGLQRLSRPPPPPQPPTKLPHTPALHVLPSPSPNKATKLTPGPRLTVQRLKRGPPVQTSRQVPGHRVRAQPDELDQGGEY